MHLLLHLSLKAWHFALCVHVPALTAVHRSCPNSGNLHCKTLKIAIVTAVLTSAHCLQLNAPACNESWLLQLAQGCTAFQLSCTKQQSINQFNLESVRSIIGAEARQLQHLLFEPCPLCSNEYLLHCTARQTVPVSLYFLDCQRF